MSRSPSLAPSLPGDHDIYLVFDDFGERLGRARRETGEERADWKTVITDLMDGQYSDPVQVMAFNTAEAGPATRRRKSRTRSPFVAAWMVLTCRRFWSGSLNGTAAAGPGSYHCRCEAPPDMPMEFYQGRPLEPEELDAIRQQIEQFDTIEAIDPEMLGIVVRNWPHLVAKLPPQATEGEN